MNSQRNSCESSACGHSRFETETGSRENPEGRGLHQQLYDQRRRTEICDPHLSALRRKGRVVDHSSVAGLAPGSPRVCRCRGDPEGTWRLRHQHRLDLAWSDERQEGTHRERRRRDFGRGLLVDFGFWISDFGLPLSIFVIFTSPARIFSIKFSSQSHSGRVRQQ